VAIAEKLLTPYFLNVDNRGNAAVWEVLPMPVENGV
jgi:hypothetical protein